MSLSVPNNKSIFRSLNEQSTSLETNLILPYSSGFKTSFKTGSIPDLQEKSLLKLDSLYIVLRAVSSASKSELQVIGSLEV